MTVQGGRARESSPQLSSAGQFMNERALSDLWDRRIIRQIWQFLDVSAVLGASYDASFDPGLKLANDFGADGFSKGTGILELDRRRD